MRAWQTPGTNHFKLLVAVGCAVLSMAGLTACGGGSNSSASSASTSANSSASSSVAPTGGAPTSGGTLRVVSAEAPDLIDPGISYSNQGWSILNMTNDGLVAFAKVGGPAGETIVPDLATNVPAPTDGGKTYTFHLRPGIKFSNGATVVASDFLTSIERLFKSSSPSPISPRSSARPPAVPRVATSPRASSPITRQARSRSI